MNVNFIRKLVENTPLNGNSKYSDFLKLSDEDIKFLDRYYDRIDLDFDTEKDDILNEYPDIPEEDLEHILNLVKDARFEMLRLQKIKDIKKASISSILKEFKIYNHIENRARHFSIAMVSNGTATLLSIDKSIDEDEFLQYIVDNESELIEKGIYKVLEFFNNIPYYIYIGNFKEFKLDSDVTVSKLYLGNAKSISYYDSPIDTLNSVTTLQFEKSTKIDNKTILHFPNLKNIIGNVTFEDAEYSLQETKVENIEQYDTSTSMYSVVDTIYNKYPNLKGLYKFFFRKIDNSPTITESGLVDRKDFRLKHNDISFYDTFGYNGEYEDSSLLAEFEGTSIATKNVLSFLKSKNITCSHIKDNVIQFVYENDGYKYDYEVSYHNGRYYLDRMSDKYRLTLEEKRNLIYFVRDLCKEVSQKFPINKPSLEELLKMCNIPYVRKADYLDTVPLFELI